MELVGPILVVLLVCAFAGLFISRAKRRAPGEGFVLGLLLGPVGLVIELAMPSESLPDGTRVATRRCPRCLEQVPLIERRCRFCDAALGADAPTDGD